MASEIRRPAPDWTIEQLRKHFGGIPAQRILRSPKPGTATEKDARTANERDGHLCELIDGTLVEKGMGTNESRIAVVLAHLVSTYLDQHPLGDVAGESGLLRLWPGILRAPDLSFFLFDSLPRGEIPTDVPYPEIVPDFAVEVLSKSNTRKEIDRKLEEFFRAGTTIVWVIDPRKGSARVHRSATDFDEIGAHGLLSAEPVLPGFSVALDKLLTPRGAASSGARSVNYPEKLEIIPLTHPVLGQVRVPGSKSITNRAMVLASLGVSSGSDAKELRGALQSEDTEVMVAALQALGFQVTADWSNGIVRIGEDYHHRIPAAQADLFTANSGTTMRFLTAMVSLGHGRYRLDGVPRMRERPIEDLLVALRQLGVRADSETGNGCPPVVIETDGLRGGQVSIKGDISSQFLSGLLMAAPFATGEIEIQVEGELVSWPYVAMTVAMMHQWGLQVETQNGKWFRIPGRQRKGLVCYDIEPDASAASYFWAAAAVTGGKITVEGLTTKSLQGDVGFVDLLEQMGCRVVRGDSGITVTGGPLHGIDVDMNDISDTVMTLGAVACFAVGPTTIRNVAHIRHKETDRLAALATELRRVGAEVDEFADGLTITPRPLHGAEIETYNDHRMAMSLALVGLRVPGVVIRNPACVAKTYPGFFQDLEKLRS